MSAAAHSAGSEAAQAASATRKAKPCKFGSATKCGNPACRFLHTDEDGGSAVATPVKAEKAKEHGSERVGKSAAKTDKDKGDKEKATPADRPERDRPERVSTPVVLTLRVRLRAWIPAEDLSSVRSDFFHSWLTSLHVETLVPEKEAHVEGTDADAWAEIQLLGEGRGVFEAFAQLQRAVGGEVDDVVLAFPVAAERVDRLCSSSASGSASAAADPLGHIKLTSAATGARIFVPGRTNVPASSLTSSSSSSSRAGSSAARSASALAVSEAPPVEVLLEGAFPAVRSAFGMCVERLVSGTGPGSARELVSASVEVPGSLVGFIIGACTRPLSLLQLWLQWRSSSSQSKQPILPHHLPLPTSSFASSLLPPASLH